MKYSVLIFIFISSCCISCKTQYRLTGNTEGNIENTVVRFIEKSNDSIVFQEETAIINGKFSFSGSYDEPKIAYLKIGENPNEFPLVLEKGNSEIVIFQNYLDSMLVKNSEENKILWQFQERYKDFKTKQEFAYTAWKEAKRTDPTTEFTRFIVTSDSLKSLLAKDEIMLIENNLTSYASLYGLGKFLNANEDSVKVAMDLYSKFPENLKKSSLGQTIQSKFDFLKRIAIGTVAPNFSGPTPDGDTLSLEEISGRVILIHFWASWSAPDRRFNKEMTSLYSQYRDKGLTILSISLDKESTKGDPNEKWITAIAEDDLIWYNISNLLSFEDPIAKLYNIRSIPQVYILDQNKVIVGKGLRGQALEDQIAKMLN